MRLGRTTLWLLGMMCIISLPSSAQQPGYPDVFDVGLFQTLNLTIDPADWATVQADESYSIEVPAQFWADGEAPILVGVRRKDAFSLTQAAGYDKVSLRIDMNEYVLGQEWNDLKQLSLENGDDENVIREGFAWQIYRLAQGTYGFNYPAARSNWVRLIINGVDTGVYVNPEMRDKRFLENRDLYIPGQSWMYEVEQTDVPINQVGAPPNSPAYEALCYDPFVGINDATCPTPDLATHIPQWVDMAGLLTIMAANAFTADNDCLITKGKNFSYADFSFGPKRRYYPWDLDSAPPGGTQYSMYQPRQIGEFVALLDVPEFRAQYNQIINDMLCGPWSVTSLHAVIDNAETLISTAVDADPNNQVGDAASEFQSIRDWVTNRVAFVTAELENFQPCTTVQLEINEVMASNATTLEDPVEPGEFPDWFELHNPATVAVDIGGIYITDNPLEPTKYQIPAGEMIPALGHYLMYADDDGTQGPEHTNFKLGSSGGETLQVYDRDGVTLLDEVLLGPQTTDVAYGRYPDGIGDWDFVPTATPGATNAPHNPPPTLSFTSRTPLWPTMSDVVLVATTAFDELAVADVTLHYDVGSGSVALPMLDDGMNGDALAGDGVYVAQIPAFGDETIVRYWITATDSLGAATQDPILAPTLSYTYQVDYAPPPLVINEFMASNATTVEDPDEPLAFEDYIEIYNAGDRPISLGGMYLTDNLFNPRKVRLEEGLIVPAGGHLLLWADSEPEQGGLHLDFRLTAAGEEIGLFDRDIHGNIPIDTVVFGLQTIDVASGRCPDGFGVTGLLASATPGSANGGCSGGLVALYGDVVGDGEVRIWIEGVLVSYTTNAGETVQQILAGLVSAILNDATLQSLGVDASSIGNQLAASGAITMVEVTDSGLSETPLDSDADGVFDNIDNCFDTSNPSQQDLDLDGVGDLCDNCISVQNFSQHNPDGDLLGSACDNCPLDYNDLQDDLDVDGFGDLCDNCPAITNPSQFDRDFDLDGDRCDLDDGYLYVTFDGAGQMVWQADSGFSDWNAYSGSLNELRLSGSYTQLAGSNPLADRVCGQLGTSWSPADPAPGDVLFVLATGDSLSGESSLGQTSAAVERVNSAPCP